MLKAHRTFPASDLLMIVKGYDNGSSDRGSALDEVSVRIQLGGSIKVVAIISLQI